MQTTRSNFNTAIASDVINGKILKYTNTKNSVACWSLYRGKKALYSNQDINNPCNTLILHSPHKSTYLFLSCDAKEISDYITNHEVNFAKILEDDERRADYIANNVWARQDEL